MPRRGHPIDIEVGARMRVLRLKAGLSQEATGDALDLTFQQIQKYEKGSNRISASKLVQLAKLFKAPVAALFGQDGKGEAVTIDPRLDTRTRHLLIDGLVKLNNPRFESILLDLVNEWNRK